MAKGRKDRRPPTRTGRAPAHVSTVPLTLAMVSLTLSGLSYTGYVAVTHTTTQDVSSDPLVLAVLLTWVGLAALGWYVFAVLRFHRRDRTASPTAKVLLVLGAVGFLAATIVSTTVPLLGTWAIADVASAVTAGAVARLRHRSAVVGVLLGLLLAMVGVTAEALLRARD